MPARRQPLINGRPAISTPRGGNPDAIAQAFDNTRERIEALEAEVLMLGRLLDANAAAAQIAILQRQVTALLAQVSALTALPEISVLTALLAQTNGIVVLRDGALITRVLAAGEGIGVLYGDGHDGNPTIRVLNVATGIPFLSGPTTSEHTAPQRRRWSPAHVDTNPVLPP